jgi:cysteine desulfurase
VTPPIYLDHQSTTPLDPRVVEAMLPYLTERFGHPHSRSHAFGWEAEKAVEVARARVADLLHAEPREIVFTSGSTEADNLALKGAAEFYGSYGQRGRHVVTTAIENRPVLDSCAWLEERRGFRVTRMRPDAAGRVAPEAIAAAIEPDTVLVSVQWANHEVGTVQPIAEIAALCRDRGVLLHSDASQAGAWLDLDVAAAGVALLSLSANKMFGPKGAGALYVRRKDPRVRVAPLLHGGDHERGMRSGTPDVPALVGFGVAAEIARTQWTADAERVAALRDRFESALRASLDGIAVNGSTTHRLPNNSNLSFDGVEGEALLVSVPDVAASTGSACTSATQEPSHVLEALGLPRSASQSSVRFSLGRPTTSDEIDRAISRIRETVPRLRALSPPR